MLNTITPITYDTVVADHELGALAQAQVNAAEAAEAGSAAPLVRLLADAKHQQWPQYVGHWNGPGWVPYRVTRRIETKLGVAFEPGDVTLGCRFRTRLWSSSTVTLYSLRNGCNTTIDATMGGAVPLEEG
jgi:hypothetical protein